MPFPSLIATGDPSSWIGAAWGGGLTGAFGIVLWLLNRAGKNADDRTADRKETAKGDASVEVERVRARADAETRYYEGLAQLQRDRAADLETLRTEMASDKRSLGHQIRNLQGQIRMVLEVYHQLFTITSVLLMQWRTMRARIKKMDPANFDEEEFPVVDIKPFDPKALFATFDAPALGTTPAQAIFSATGEDGRKMTGRIDIEPRDR